MARSSSRGRSDNERIRAAQRSFRPPVRHEELVLAGPEHEPPAYASAGAQGAVSTRSTSEEFHAYAPPGGFTALLNGIVDDLGPAARDNGGSDHGRRRCRACYRACRAYCEPQGPISSRPIPVGNGRCNSRGKRERRYAKSRSTILPSAIGWPRNNSREIVDKNTRIIYLVDPNNPLGVCYTREEIRAFCDIARRVGALVLHDCTYRDFADDHVLAARFYPEGAITIYSFSKWLGPGRTAHRRRGGQ